jgi:hypothetical protein
MAQGRADLEKRGKIEAMKTLISARAKTELKLMVSHIYIVFVIDDVLEHIVNAILCITDANADKAPPAIHQLS